MSNIILIGMPGCGKSTVGVVLAKTLGIGFVDTDLIIQQNENRLLQDIIDSDGIDYFLDCEEKAIKTLNCKNSVIATGGSVVFRDGAMEHLKKLGKICYIDVPVNVLIERLNNIKTRGIAAKKGQTVESIYNERAMLYKKYCDFSVELHNVSVEKAVETIKQKIK